MLVKNKTEKEFLIPVFDALKTFANNDIVRDDIQIIEIISMINRSK